MIISNAELDVKTLVRYAMQAAEEELDPAAGAAFSGRLREIYDDLRLREAYLDINSGKGLQSVKEIVSDLTETSRLRQRKPATTGLRLVTEKKVGPGAA